MGARVRLNEFERQWRDIGQTSLNAVDRVGRSGWFILGNEVRQFEEKLAEISRVPHAVGCASGLDALEIALLLVGFRQGDFVITTPLSAFATTLAIVRLGGVPVFVDVDESGLLDLNQVADCLETAPKDKKIIVLPVHLFGHCINLEALAQLRDRYVVPIIEDGAQAIGAASASYPMGAVGEVTGLSFYPTKNLGCLGDGGALLTHSAEHAEKAKALRDYGQVGKYHHSVLGLNSRLDEVQAAIMCDALLPKLSEVTERRREIAARYRESISHRAITIPPAPFNSKSVYHLFPILVEEDREDLRSYLNKSGVETAIHYPTAIPNQPALENVPFVVHADLRLTQKFCRSEVSLPIHPYLTDAEIDHVITACNSWPA